MTHTSSTGFTRATDFSGHLPGGLRAAPRRDPRSATRRMSDRSVPGQLVVRGAQVERDPVQPCRKQGAAAETGQGPVRPNERHLHQVILVVRIPHTSADNIAYLDTVFLSQHTAGTGITSFRPGDQGLFLCPGHEPSTSEVCCAALNACPPGLSVRGLDCANEVTTPAPIT